MSEPMTTTPAAKPAGPAPPDPAAPLRAEIQQLRKDLAARDADLAERDGRLAGFQGQLTGLIQMTVEREARKQRCFSMGDIIHKLAEPGELAVEPDGTVRGVESFLARMKKIRPEYFDEPARMDRRGDATPAPARRPTRAESDALMAELLGRGGYNL